MFGRMPGPCTISPGTRFVSPLMPPAKLLRPVIVLPLMTPLAVPTCTTVM